MDDLIQNVIVLPHNILGLVYINDMGWHACQFSKIFPFGDDVKLCKSILFTLTDSA